MKNTDKGVGVRLKSESGGEGQRKVSLFYFAVPTHHLSLAFLNASARLPKMKLSTLCQEFNWFVLRFEGLAISVSASKFYLSMQQQLERISVDCYNCDLFCFLRLMSSLMGQKKNMSFSINFVSLFVIGLLPVRY